MIIKVLKMKIIGIILASLCAVMMESTLHAKVEAMTKLQPDDTSYVEETFYKVISNSRLNVREKPSVNSLILGSLNPGTVVQGRGFDSEWTEIDYNNKPAYVATRYLNIFEIKRYPVITISPVAEKVDSISSVKDTLMSEQIEIPSKWSLFELLSVDAIASGCVGYSDFISKQSEAIGRLGFGIEASLQGELKDNLGFIPKGWYAETGIGYSLKGSAAYPMHYINIKVAPFGYACEFLPIPITTNLGFFMGIPLSVVETNIYRFKSHLDLGLYAKIACWYRDIGIGLSYEYSFTNVCNANTPLKNNAVFLNISYRIHNINNSYSR